MNTTPEPVRDLTLVVQATRRGLRRDVAAFANALVDGELVVPLLHDTSQAQEGERVAIDGSLELVPHLITDDESQAYAVLFTQAELMKGPASALEWTTDGGDLKGCTLPAMIACQMALDAIDEKEIFGLVLNPGEESELFLRRSELASIVAGEPIPLVGYLADLPPLEDERILVAEGPGLGDDLVREIGRCLSELPAVTGHKLERTFNPERDLEPHPTLTVIVADPEADHRAIAQKVIALVGESLPPPGYLDILFAEPDSAPV